MTFFAINIESWSSIFWTRMAEPNKRLELVVYQDANHNSLCQ